MTKCTNQNDLFCASIQIYAHEEFFYKNLLTKVPYGCIIDTEVREKPETQK
nr:MAG TPA: hypothetical protein [Caudoviricetes sp.]